MGPPSVGSLVLDAGALIALERGDRRMLALLAEAETVVVPAGVVAQAWRGSARQAPIARVLGAIETVVEPLDHPTARAAGLLCGAAGSSDVIDASVAIAGRRHDALVATSDPDDLLAIDPDLRLHVC